MKLKDQQTNVRHTEVYECTGEKEDRNSPEVAKLNSNFNFNYNLS